MVLQQLQWHRMLACGAAALLVHYLVAGWMDSAEAGAAPPAKLAPVLVFAQLQPVTRNAGNAAHAVPPAVSLAEASAAVPKRQVQSARKMRRAGQTRAAAGRLRSAPPPTAQLTYELVKSGAGYEGAAAHGEALLDWHQERGAYQLRYSAMLTQPVPGQLLALTSNGAIGSAGIAPRTMTQQHRNRAHTATHFSEQGNITFSAAQSKVPTQMGAQDKATWPMQLAAIGRADPSQLAAGVTLLVADERQASEYRFVLLGQEQLATSLGSLATWHMARLVPPGSYYARLDIWLAPEYTWYPVQLRSTEANGTVTTQTIRKIVVNEAGN